MSVRAFVAIAIPERLSKELRRIEAALSGRIGSGASWVRPENVHLTIKFLGEIDDASVGRAAEALGTAASASKPFSLRASGIGSFPPGGRPRVVWAGMDASAGLDALHKAVEDALAASGFARDDRGLSPHLTICRIKTPAAARAAWETIRSFEAGLDESFDVGGFSLYRSELKPAGAVYTELRRFTLAG